MGKPKGFIEIPRQEPEYRPVEERLKDFNEVENHLNEEQAKQQAARCMNCGIPFCHGCGCPLANVIPEMNELIYDGHWRDALKILLSTSNFPEVTGRICPALCETSCTIGIHGGPVSVRQLELWLIEKGFKEGVIKPSAPAMRTGRKIAIVGSGPAGLAAADILNKKGHAVTVFEKDKYAGGLLRYGIPDFKLSKAVVQRRINLMAAEGVCFETGVEIGKDIAGSYLNGRFDAICLCNGAKIPRDLQIPGRELDGIHFAMDYLRQQNCRVSGEPAKGQDILAKGRKVVVIGGGDTGSDCVGTALRQGAKAVTQIEIMPQPPEERHESTPWPQWPYQLRTSSSHKEGCKRLWNVQTKSFSGSGNIKKLNLAKVEWETDKLGRPVKIKEIPGSEFSLETDMALLAMGFTGPQKFGAIEQFGVKLDARGNVAVDQDGQTSEQGIFAAGDIAAGPSLAVRAIAAGRKMAGAVDAFLKKN
jgi:glutamate synthase (NADPH/NADH) small chain